MKKIISFTSNELDLINRFSPVLAKIDKTLFRTFSDKKDDLETLGEIVSNTPALTSTIRHFFKSRTLNTMAELLHSGGTHNVLNIPTKAVLGRSFTITKINFFSFILKIAEAEKTIQPLVKEVKKLLDRIVFTLMAEEVYTAIIENDKGKESFAKAAAEELVYLWEYRMDRNLDSFAPPLMALWKARCGIAPVLGTLQGTVELIQLSANLPDIWNEFLSGPNVNGYIEQALEEFIFGLSYEEISYLRNDMMEKGIYVIEREKALKMLQKAAMDKFSCDNVFISGEAKKIYSFYLRRKESAKIRSIKNENGPKYTIEELFLIYLLEKKIKSANLNIRSKIISFFS